MKAETTIQIDNEQARVFATYISFDIAAYIKEHEDEFNEFLKEEKTEAD